LAKPTLDLLDDGGLDLVEVLPRPREGVFDVVIVVHGQASNKLERVIIEISCHDVTNIIGYT
jgi:hypothetical protein